MVEIGGYGKKKKKILTDIYYFEHGAGLDKCERGECDDKNGMTRVNKK